MRASGSLRRLRVVRLALVVWSAAIVFLLLLPGGDLPSVPGWVPALLAAISDKLVHCGLFFVWAGLAAMAVVKPYAKRGLAAIFLASVAFGGALELAQGWVPGRDPSWGDLAADALGTLLILALVLLYFSVGKRRRSRVSSR